MMTVDCAGCQRPILDRFLLHFMDKTWHSQCVKCQLCRRLLDDKCFFRDGKIYCRDDFYRYSALLDSTRNRGEKHYIGLSLGGV